MKHLFFKLSIIIGFLFFTSCNSNDTPITNETIEGSWHLKNISGGLLGVDIDYGRGKIIWKFNTQSNTVTVENNIPTTNPENFYPDLPAGTYNYIIEEHQEIKTLFINDTKKGVIIIENNILKIDDNLAADGLLTLFER